MNSSVRPDRYARMTYRHCGRSGLTLPAISLGLWQNFSDGSVGDDPCARIFTAFDLGITHFDLANNYGEPPGSAERIMGRALLDLRSHREELLIATKAGVRMWDGPYGDGGSRKYLIQSLDQSLKRLGLDHVDIFYHHRHDPQTPLEETMGALDQVVRSGKALYVGISNYRPEQAEASYALLKNLGTPCLIHQHNYSMLNRTLEHGGLEAMRTHGVGAIAFGVLAQGLLTDRYFDGIPAGSRATHSAFLPADRISVERIALAKALHQIAIRRGQTLAQMAVTWTLRDPQVASAIIGASSQAQILDNVRALEAPPLSTEELHDIDRCLASFAPPAPAAMRTGGQTQGTP